MSRSPRLASSLRFERLLARALGEDEVFHRGLQIRVLDHDAIYLVASGMDHCLDSRAIIQPIDQRIFGSGDVEHWTFGIHDLDFLERNVLRIDPYRATFGGD